MDQQTLVFDISSDEEFGLDNSSSADNFDWISKLLEDDDDIAIPTDVPNGQDAPSDAINHVNAGNADSKVYSNAVDTDDDDVVVVGEVIANPRRAKKPFHNTGGGGGDDDDDCLVLDFDPDKPPEKAAPAVTKDYEVKDCDPDDDDDDDEDDLVVVAEKGQVACRDFPHPRHLCANFPYSSTPHDSRCEMCHCYVCDSLAPCAHWGSGASTADHCNATDKGEYWQLERKRLRNLKNPSLATAKHVASLPQLPRLPHLCEQADVLPRAAADCGVPSPIGVPDIISQCRSQRETVTVARNRVVVARNRYQPHLVSRQLPSTCNNNAQSNGVVQSAPRMVSSCALFKRPGFASRSGMTYRSTFGSPNNVSVPFLQRSQQWVGKPYENSSSNSRGSSPRLVISPGSCPSNASRISPRTLPSPLQGHGLPSPQTPTSRFQGCGQSSAVMSDQPYLYSSVNQTHSTSCPIIPSNTSSALNGISQSSQQHSSITETISGPNFASSRSDRRSYQPSAVTQTRFSPVTPCTSDALNNVAQSSWRQPFAENSIVDGLVPMHEHLPSVEQEPQTSLDIDFNSWLQDNEPDGSFFDLSSQPPVTAPIDPGMLYFDFETSWQGLTHT